MNALTDTLAESVERECNVIQFTAPDHDEKGEKMADLHRRHAAEMEQTIAATKKQLRKAVAAHRKEIARLERQIAEAEAGASRKIAALDKMLAADRAYLDAAE